MGCYFSSVFYSVVERFIVMTSHRDKKKKEEEAFFIFFFFFFDCIVNKGTSQEEDHVGPNVLKISYSSTYSYIPLGASENMN